MALLTNPNAGDSKLAKFLINNSAILCIILYWSGVIWFLSLAHKPFNDGTYFSENALLPGLVQNSFDEDLTAKKLHSELQKVMHLNPNGIPSDWLIEKFNQMNIDAYTHNFTLTYPLINNTIYHGKNIYGILRAPRSSSTEGLIVTVPFRALGSPNLDSTPSIALVLALAKFCRKHKYWAKDIIFLITDHEQLGTQAWLQAYHNVQMGSGILNHGNIDARAGSIQAAINLEIHSLKISHIDVKVEGLNGQLPNLDLVNLVHRLCKNEGIQHTFKNRNNPRKRDSPLQQWLHSLVTLISMVWTQASCVPNGNHGLYHRFGIEAVTLEGFEPAPNSHRQVSGLYQAGRVLEGILRSLNNLLERFHQSYFFYLLPSNDRFIPIGSYMPSVSLIGVPLVIKGLATWLKLYNYFKLQVSSKTGKSEKKLQQNDWVDGGNLKFLTIATSFLIAHFFGWLYLYSGVELSKIGFKIFGFTTKVSVYIGFLIFSILSLSTPYFIKLSQIELDILYILALIELATLLLIVALHNFSLSLILAIVFVPCVCFISSRCKWWKKTFCSLFMITINPFVFIHLVVLGYTYITQGESNIIMKTFSATQHSFIYLMMDDMIYGNWLIKVVFGFFIPNWISFWLFLHC